MGQLDSARSSRSTHHPRWLGLPLSWSSRPRNCRLSHGGARGWLDRHRPAHSPTLPHFPAGCPLLALCLESSRISRGGAGPGELARESSAGVSVPVVSRPSRSVLAAAGAGPGVALQWVRRGNGVARPCPRTSPGRYGPLKGTLLLGVVWAGWHVPLFWTVEGYRSMSLPMIIGGFGVGICAGSVVLAALPTAPGVAFSLRRCGIPFTTSNRRRQPAGVSSASSVRLG